MTEDEKRKKRRLYYLANRERILAARKAYVEKMKPWASAKQRAYRKRWAKKNRAKVLAKNQEWQHANRKKTQQYSAKWRGKNPEKLKAAEQRRWKTKRAALIKKHKAWKLKNPEAWKRLDRRSGLKKHGLTEEAYAAMLEAQGHACAICLIPASEFRREMHLDHDHLTGLARAILCHRCNVGIGMLGDDHARVVAAAKYLKKHHAKRELHP